MVVTVNTDYTDKDISRFKVVFTLAVSGTECVAGIAGNGFITAILGAEWARRRRLPAGDSILLALSLSRLLLQIWMAVDTASSLLFRATYNRNAVYIPFKVIVMFLNYSNLWLAAWLTIFYCLKIANLAHRLFSAMRRKLPVLTPWLLRLTLLVSLGFSFPFSRDVFNVYVNSSVPGAPSNATERHYLAETNVANLALLYHLGVLLPLATFVLAASLPIASLKRHALRMGSQATGSRDPSVEAHLGAIRAIGYFFILYVFNAVALFLSTSNVFDASSAWDILCKVITAAYPAVHSVLLILGNPGLRRAWRRFRH